MAELAGIREQSPGNHPTSFSLLVGVAEIDFNALANARRTQRGFPAMNASALDGEREKDVGVAEYIVVEEVARVCLEVRKVDRPTAQWNAEAKFALLVVFPV